MASRSRYVCERLHLGFIKYCIMPGSCRLAARIRRRSSARRMITDTSRYRSWPARRILDRIRLERGDANRKPRLICATHIQWLLLLVDPLSSAAL